MIKMPAPALIHQVELRCAQSTRQVCDGLQRLRTASREKLVRPSMLIMVASVTGLFGFWVARRTRRSHSTGPRFDLLGAAKTSALGLGLAWLLRLGIRRLARTARS